MRHAVQRLQDILPSSWQINLYSEVTDHQPGRQHDAELVVRTPVAQTIFVVEVKTSDHGSRSAQDVVDQLRHLAQGRPGLVMTNFANPALRQVCEDAGVSYLDETGWVYLRSDDTGLFVVHEGAKRSPSSGKRDATMSRLDGRGASAVIRSLWVVETPIGVRALASHAHVSPGTVAKVLPSLARYGAIERDSTGAVAVVDRRLLLERWVQDYGFFTTNSNPHWFLAPRGIESLYAQLWKRYDSSRTENDEIQVQLALTGYIAAVQVLPKEIYPVIPPTLLSIYAADPELMASSLTLRPATRQTANVVIVKPRDASLLSRDPLSVPISQALADLMTMGSRFPELAEQVLDVLTGEDL